MEWWHRYLCIPFQERGRGWEGIDCWGLVALVYQEQKGITLPDYLDCYENTQQAQEISAEIKTQSQISWIEVVSPQPFDVALVRMRGVPMHVGILTKAGWMLHASHGVGVTHERIDGMRWKNRVLGFYKHQCLCVPASVQQQAGACSSGAG
jgi:cell wall-associated NlpC family hydrolase